MNSPKSRQNPVLILGGGLAGLSAAYHLKTKTSLLIEKENQVGGTARSYQVKGFTFDYTGHLLHLHFPTTKRLIKKILKNNFFWCKRDTWIFSENTYTKYPYQANTFGLPEITVDDCVVGFFETNYQNPGREKSDSNFKKWCFDTFGPGISKHFMIPYNEKLYRTKTELLNIDWCGPFVPKPRLEDVIKGGLGTENRGFGYNQNFLYPKRGGIQSLSLGLARHLKNIKLQTSVEKIDWGNKKARLSNSQVVPYSKLINTMPLPELLKVMSPLPRQIRMAAEKLKFVSIICINMGVKRPKISQKSWIYFPEKEFPFYRVGFPMNFTPHVVPRGQSSMYIEISLKPGEKYAKKVVLNRTIKGLIKCGILKKSDKISAVQFLPIKYAYVIYNQNRKMALKQIMDFLKRQGILSIGRYGAWKYSFMEEAILDGKKAAAAIIKI